jgi:hypothetical protein
MTAPADRRAEEVIDLAKRRADPSRLSDRQRIVALEGRLGVLTDVVGKLQFEVKRLRQVQARQGKGGEDA